MMRAAVARIPEMILLSDVPGRQRWSLPAIDSKPRLAAAVELALRKESGAVLVKVNPLTGRILLKWHPSQRPPEIRSIVRKALDKGPVSIAAYQKHHGTPDSKVRKLISKLVLGGIKLTLILFSRAVWGAVGSGSACRSHHGYVDFRHDYHRIRLPEGLVPNGNRPEGYHDRHPDWRGNIVEHRAE